MEYCLTTQGLCKAYRHGRALDGLTMQVPKGGRHGRGYRTGVTVTCTRLRLISSSLPESST